jgi:two-component system OmpR family response regulator
VAEPGLAILRVMRPRLLIVEDDADLRQALVRSLDAEGFAVRAVATGHELVERAVAAPVDALVIDIGLPDSDGRDVCQALRARGVTAPILFLTARDALADRLSGFSAGGDDYVTKPFDIEELTARLHALMRRAGAPTQHSRAGLLFDPTQLSISIAGQAQTLTPTEFRLLAMLASKPEHAVSRGELISAAWPHGAIVHDNTLDVYVARLRRKLRALDGAPGLTTVHGLGYKLA